MYTDKTYDIFKLVIKMNNNLNQENNQTFQNNFQQTNMQPIQQPQPMQTQMQHQIPNYEPPQNPQQNNNTPEKKNNSGKIILIIIIIIAVIIALFIGIAKILNLSSKDNDNSNSRNNSILNVNSQVEESRKYYYIQTVYSYINSAKIMWFSDSLTCNGIVPTKVENGDYYIMIDTRDGARQALPELLDMGGKSPWNNEDMIGHVRVNISTNAENQRETKYYISITDGTHTIMDDNITQGHDLKKENIIMKTDKKLFNKIKMTTDEKDTAGKYTGTSDCTFDPVNNKYTCSKFIGYDNDAVSKMKAICIEAE